MKTGFAMKYDFSKLEERIIADYLRGCLDSGRVNIPEEVLPEEILNEWMKSFPTVLEWMKSNERTVTGRTPSTPKFQQGVGHDGPS